MMTVDDDISIGFYQAYPYEPIGNKPFDQPVVASANQLDSETRRPVENHSIRAIQAGGGRVFSNEPMPLEIVGPYGDLVFIHGFMMQLVFDLNNLSRPNLDPPMPSEAIELSEGLRLPEVSQRNLGLFCGAVKPEFLNRPIVFYLPSPFGSPTDFFGFPSPSSCCRNHGDQKGTPYRVCVDGILTDDCDSIGDMFRDGCTLSLPTGFDLSAIIAAPCSSRNPTVAAIDGIDYDADSDGDGKNDSWSALFGFEAQRVRIYDIEKQ